MTMDSIQFNIAGFVLLIWATIVMLADKFLIEGYEPLTKIIAIGVLVILATFQTSELTYHAPDHDNEKDDEKKDEQKDKGD